MASVPEILKGQGETLLLHSHLMQMLTFVRGGGVEFIPAVDEGDIRKGYLDRLCRDNKLPLKLRSMVIRMIGQGRFLLYLRPTGESYRFESYPRRAYQANYDANGDLESAIVIYSYKVRPLGGGQLVDRWVWLRITKDAIEKAESDAKFTFDQAAVVPDSVVPNSLGFMPCVEVLNPPPGSEELGESDFEALSGQIEAHDEMVTTILDNLDFYCSSPITTTEDPDEIAEFRQNKGVASDRDSVAAVSGFGEMRDPFQGGNPRQRRRDRRLKRIIGPFEPGAMLQQIQIQALPPNQLAFAADYERQLREAMGGILERGIETATESRLVYGKVEVTAREKQEALFTYGLCRVLEMVLLAEEALHVATKGKEGLPPLGDRTITYRVSPVFVQTAKDIQERSIVGRNLGELGVSAKETLKFVFPDKRETEIDRLVGDSGLPFRYLNQVSQIIDRMSTLIDPMTGTPLLDPRTGYPLVYALLPKLLESLDYGSQFSPAEPPSPAATTAESDALSAALSRVAGRRSGNRRSPPGGRVEPVGNGNSRESVQLPSPGSTVNAPSEPGPSSGGGFFDLRRSPILNFFRR